MEDKAKRTININEKFLKLLEPKEKKQLALNVKRGNFKKGDVIVKEDKCGDILYYLENRVYKIKKELYIGKKKFLGKILKMVI